MVKRYYQDMPAGTINIHCIQLFAIFGFAALLAMLNQYLQAQGMPIEKANLLTASFFALNFLLHFLGGSLGGCLISYRSLFTWSLSLQVLGLVLMSPSTLLPHSLALMGMPLSALNVIILGMAFFVTGSGLNVSCVNMMLTQLFDNTDHRRRVAFSVNYSLMNVGFFISYIITNFWQVNASFGAIFFISILSLLVAFVFHFFAWKHVHDKQTYFITKFARYRGWYLAIPVVMVVCLAMSYFLLHYLTIAAALIDSVFVITLVAMIMLALRQPQYYRRCILVYIVVVAAGMVFAFVQGLQASGLQNFIRFNTNGNLLGLSLSPSGVNSFESLGVIVFGLLLARQLKQWRSQGKMPPSYVLVCRGLGFSSLAFLMIPLGIYSCRLGPGSHVQVFFPVLLSLLIAAAEVHINTTNYALVGETAKPQHQGFFTGYLFVNIAVGNQLAGYFSNVLTGGHQHLNKASAATTNPIYFKMFLILAGISFMLTLIYVLLSYIFKRLGILLSDQT